jgi:hypothetical protein
MISSAHRNTGSLLPSKQDDIQLCLALEEKYIELSRLYERAMGVPLVPPRSMDSDMFLWRTLMARIKSGDFRHTANEYRALKTMAQWTVDMKCSLCGQPTKKIEWKD